MVLDVVAEGGQQMPRAGIGCWCRRILHQSGLDWPLNLAKLVGCSLEGLQKAEGGRGRFRGGLQKKLMTAGDLWKRDDGPLTSGRGDRGGGREGAIQ